MKSLSEIAINEASNNLKKSILELLRSENLPIEDLQDTSDGFFVALDGENVIGTIGLEKYQNCGLLRSMVVKKNFRNAGVAASLLRKLEEKASSLGINCIYLLTETASSYFEKKGYERIDRTQVPSAIMTSSEFSSVCPVSAIVMKKTIAKDE